MESLLSKWIPDSKNTSDPNVRQKYGVLVSAIGIMVNIALFAGKLTVGWLANSIAVMADAVNNLSDAGSSIISLVSFKISAKPADKEHPYGHARIEYVASMIVAFIILLIGFSLLKESVIKIFNPETTRASVVSVAVLVASVLAKLWLGLFYRRIGKKINSSVMRAAATDSFTDVISTGAVLIAILILYIFDVDIDAYMGVAVALLILYAGIQILNDTKNSILGTAPDTEVIESMLAIVRRYPEALGVHDVFVHNYGPGRIIASMHVEVDASQDIMQTHDAIDNIERSIRSELGIQATIHLDPIIVDDERVNELRAKVHELVKEVDPRLDIHDFRFVEGVTHTNLIFDIEAQFEVKLSNDKIVEEVSKKIKQLDDNYFAVITVDRG